MYFAISSFASATIWSGDRKRIDDNPVFGSLDPIDLVGLHFYGHVFVDYAYAALASYRNRHFGFGDGIHCGRHKRDVKAYILCKAVFTEMSAGRISDLFGISNTSSKVSPSFKTFLRHCYLPFFILLCPIRHTQSRLSLFKRSSSCRKLNIKKYSSTNCLINASAKGGKSRL